MEEYVSEGLKKTQKNLKIYQPGLNSTNINNKIILLHHERADIDYTYWYASLSRWDLFI